MFTHTIIIPRIEDNRTTMGAVVTLLTTIPYRTAAYEALEIAVSHWLTTTDGIDAWENSSETFNIGDLALEIDIELGSICRSLRECLSKHGIHAIEIQSHDCISSYDKILTPAKTTV